MKRKLIALGLSLMILSTTLSGTGMVVNTADAATYVDKSEEYNLKFIGELLARVGRGYGADNSGNGHLWGTYPDSKSYNCTGLVSASLRAMNFACPSSAGWSKWGKTVDWKSWFNERKDGEIVELTVGSNVYRFKVVKTSSKTQDLNLYKTYASKPGTIMLKMAPGDTSGHMAVSLGYFPYMGSIAATENYVRNALIAKYSDAVAKSVGITHSDRAGANLAAILKAGGANNVYGHQNVWDYRNDTVQNRTDIGYNGIWQVDALNDKTGVTINNNPYGKTLNVTVLGILVPEDDTVHGQVRVTITKTDSATKEALSGAVFTLYEWSEKSNAYVVSTQAEIKETSTKGTYSTYTKASSGVSQITYIEFTPDNQGKIKVVETTAPPGHTNIDPNTGKAYEWSYTFTQDASNPTKIFNQTISAINRSTSILIRKIAK